MTVQLIVAALLVIAGFALQLWAFIDCVRRPPTAFTISGNQTKVVWMVITGVALAIGFLSLPTRSLAQANPMNMFFLLAVVGAAVYMVRVRPAIRGFGGGRR